MRPLSRGVVVIKSVLHKVCEGMRRDQVQVFNAEISHHHRQRSGIKLPLDLVSGDRRTLSSCAVQSANARVNQNPRQRLIPRDFPSFYLTLHNLHPLKQSHNVSGDGRAS